jgi:septum formation protein
MTDHASELTLRIEYDGRARWMPINSADRGRQGRAATGSRPGRRRYSGRMTTTPRLVLASASPARLRTLRAAGIEADVIVSGVDESTVDSTRADVLSLTLARMKAEAVVSRLRGSGGTGTTLVLGCDSVLSMAGRILGKPRDAADARNRWREMRGGNGVLCTGHCLIEVESGKRVEAGAATTVHFGDVTDSEIDAYVRTGEPLNMAGAFTIDGLGSAFVESIEGDAGTVIGLSMPLLRRLLGELGVAITDLWRVPQPGRDGDA